MKVINTILIATLITSAAFGQTKMVITSASNISIYGTSNVHDWSEHCESQVGSITANMEEGKLSSIDNLNFTVNVKQIKSGKSTMDNYTYEALLEEDFPTITFSASDVSLSQSGSTYNVKANGKMKIAGQTKAESVEATCTYDGTTLKCSGKKQIDMTSYGVEPPNVMFGAMTVGKDVEVQYEIQFK